MEIVTKRSGKERLNITKNYDIMYQECNAIYYWIGSTTERFSISDTAANESTDININPNSGSNVSGTVLDFNWVSNTDELTRHLFAGTENIDISTDIGDNHVLIVFPTASLNITNLSELVIGQLYPLEQNIHFDTFNISDGTTQYTVLYMRDITNLTYQTVRTFNFDIIEI
jgi:hypothetical protein